MNEILALGPSPPRAVQHCLCALAWVLAPAAMRSARPPLPRAAWTALTALESGPSDADARSRADAVARCMRRAHACLVHGMLPATHATAARGAAQAAAANVGEVGAETASGRAPRGLDTCLRWLRAAARVLTACARAERTAHAWRRLGQDPALRGAAERVAADVRESATRCVGGGVWPPSGCGRDLTLPCPLGLCRLLQSQVAAVSYPEPAAFEASAAARQRRLQLSWPRAKRAARSQEDVHARRLQAQDSPDRTRQAMALLTQAGWEATRSRWASVRVAEASDASGFEVAARPQTSGQDSAWRSARAEAEASARKRRQEARRWARAATAARARAASRRRARLEAERARTVVQAQASRQRSELASVAAQERRRGRLQESVRRRGVER